MTSPDFTRILLVEDNRDFSRAGFEYLRERGLEVDLAFCFSPAICQLETISYDGVVIDCFFPRCYKGDNKDLGSQVVEKLFSDDKNHQRILMFEKALDGVIDLSDPELRLYVRSYYDGIKVDSPEDDPSFRAIKHVSKTSSVEVASLCAKNTFGMIHRDREGGFKDYYEEMMKAIDEDSSNQPLGIMVGQKCEEKGIPFVLATSTNHHDILTRPVANYCGRIGWSLIDCMKDCEDDKASPEYWGRVYEELVRKGVGGGK
ncbi:response regulator [Candidatus Pacearchaeota archaeon]|nr:response regulator [Candidatus Pacearchaeota archaeon]